MLITILQKLPFIGGRGITLCPEWKQFEGFYKDMGGSYFHPSEIDRIDPNGGYTKDNCRWTTRKQNCRNRRNTTFVTVDGETKSLGEWCEITGTNYGTAKMRIRCGWTGSSIFSKPREGYLHKLTEESARQIRVEAANYSYPILAAKYGVSVQTICHVVLRRSWKHV